MPCPVRSFHWVWALASTLLASCGGSIPSEPPPLPPPPQPPPPTWPVISGKVFGVYPGPEWIGDVRVYVGEGSNLTSVDASSDGSFSLEFRSSDECTNIRVEDKNPLGSKLKGSLGKICRPNFRDATFIRVPSERKVERGVYRGELIPISLEEAYKPIPNNISFFFRFSTSQGWHYRTAWVPGENLPFPTAFAQATSPQDSALRWAVIDSIEKILGEDLLRPTNLNDLPQDGGLRLVIDPSLVAPGEGSFTVGSNGINGGTIVMKDGSGFTSVFLMSHDLFHVLSFGHTCEWKTVMFSGFVSECPDGPRSEAITKFDVAYRELFTAVQAAARQHRARFSIAEAHQWERVTNGLPQETVRY